MSTLNLTTNNNKNTVYSNPTDHKNKYCKYEVARLIERIPSVLLINMW